MTNASAANFGIAMLFVLPVCWLILIYFKLWRPEQAVMFGSKLGLIGQQAGYPHSCLRPTGPRIAIINQFILSVLMLAALASDNWSQTYTDLTVIFGSTGARGAISSTYSSSSYTNYATYEFIGDKWMIGAGALTLTWGCLALVIMLGLMHQLVSLAMGKTQYHEYHYRAAVFQFIQVWMVLLQWLFSGEVYLIGKASTNRIYMKNYNVYFGFASGAKMAIGPSWILVGLAMFFSLWMMIYVRNAIEYRRSPSDHIYVQVAQVAPMVPPGAAGAGAANNPVSIPMMPMNQNSVPSVAYGVPQPYQPQPLMIHLQPQGQQYQPLQQPQIYEGIVAAPPPGATPVPVASPSRFCWSCGSPIAPNARNCSNCGTNLNQQA